MTDNNVNVYVVSYKLDKLREILTQVLPGLSQIAIADVMLKLEEIGMDTLDDLAHVQDGDLVPPLKLLHARRFITQSKEQSMSF